MEHLLTYVRTVDIRRSK